MDYGGIKDALGENAFDLISMGGQVHPYVGLALAVLVGVGLIFFSVKAAQQAWQKRKKKAGEAISDTGKEQDSAEEVEDGVDDFLDGGGRTN